jgi:hypothetical protein
MPGQAGDAGPGRLVQLAGGGYYNIGSMGITVGCSDCPGIGGFVKGGTGDFLIETDVVSQVVFFNAVLHIAKDFRL